MTIVMFLLPVIVLASYGLGRSREAVWWLRTIRETGDTYHRLWQAGQLGADARLGYIVAQSQMLDALTERDKTFTGRWLS